MPPGHLPNLPPAILAALAFVEYDRRWLDFGVLTLGALGDQFAQIQRGDDPNPEHYRYRTIVAFIGAQPTLTDELLENLILLLRIDPDQLMASSVRAHNLLPHPGLTDAQFQRIASLPEVERHSPREAWRARLLRRLGAGEWSPDLLDLCLTRGDTIVHRELLDHPRLDRPTLFALSTRGINNAIRNQAAQLLLSRRFRSE